MKQFITTCFLACVASIALSQVSNNNYSILFKSGIVTPDANAAAYSTTADYKHLPMFDGNYYALMQFYAIPGEKQKAEIEQNGIRLLNYLPHNAWLVAIPVEQTTPDLSRLNVRSILPLTDQQKISEELKSPVLPDYAVKVKGTVDVVVTYFKNANAENVAKALKSAGCEILNKGKNLTTYTVRVNSANGVAMLAGLSFVQHIQAIPPPPVPDDTKGRSLHRSNYINSDNASGLHFDGTGVTAAIADDGSISHIDFKGRLTDLTEQGQAGNHGDMTSGICVGAGNLDPVIRGMGSGAHLVLFDIFGSSLGDYPQIVNAVDNYNNHDVVIVSTSYSQGCNDYNTFSQEGDMLLHNNQQLIFCFSAGNNNGNDCGYGAGGQWGNITGGYKQGKNVTTCANIDAFGVIDNTSSHGPASDGRIKPDISANGKDQMSTDEANGYQVGGGTSAASPGVAGCYTQLYQAYKSMNGGANPDGALIKACILNSANEIGNPGPDYKFGWGQINVKRAYSTLADGHYLSSTLSQGNTNTHTISVPAGTAQVKVMVYWNDVEGDPAALKALVNNIDLTITDPTSATLLPLVLDPTPNATTLNANAVPGVDTLNNMEQVTIDAPSAGTYTVNVIGTEVPQGPQSYYVVWEFINDEIAVTYPNGGEGFVPNEQETIRWDAYGSTGTFLVEYSTDNGATYNIASGAVLGSSRQFTWTVPPTVTGEAKIRVSRNAISDENDQPFAIIGTAANLAVDWSCPDSIRLKWDTISGASGYVVYQLGAYYMDSIGTTATNNYIVYGTNPIDDYWFSVAPITASSTYGRRCLAINKQPGISNCPLALDVQVTSVIAPGAGILQDCQDNSAIVVTLLIENKGQNPVTNIPVYYTLNGGATVAETYTGTIAPFGNVTYQFIATVNMTSIGSYTLKVWTAYTGDLNLYNDTVTNNINVISGTLASIPYIEDFESMSICSNASDCEATVCPLGNGMLNLTNGSDDDIDFRVSSGSTPSTATGPDVDHTTGGAGGKYIYLEASVCFDKKSTLLTPCIDLTGTLSPQLSFWYHMYGAAMGSLTVDILADNEWTLNYAQINGDQGNIWHQSNLSLVPFIGKIINVRFRGETGPDFTSDIALDDIGVTETSAPPVVLFNANLTTGCTGAIITFTDQSSNNPTSWNWTITPATFTFVNGTSATSQNPQVQFNATGSYDVSLSATNGFGTGSSSQTSYINILAAMPLPVTEDFQGVSFPPQGWALDNTNGGYTWEKQVGVTGSSGTATDAAYVNNFAYNAPGDEDYLMTNEVDISGISNPILFFDVAYARYNDVFSDTLRVDVSTDCGANYYNTIYYKGGTDLATVPDQTGLWSPLAANEWRRDSVYLPTNIGQQLKIRFTNINGYGNSLFIDNINIATATGIYEANSNNSLIIAPNPSNGKVQITINGIFTESSIININDTKGRLIRSINTGTLNSNSFTIDMSDEAKGIYFIEWRNRNEIRKTKMIIM